MSLETYNYFKCNLIHKTNKTTEGGGGFIIPAYNFKRIKFCTQKNIQKLTSFGLVHDCIIFQPCLTFMDVFQRQFYAFPQNKQKKKQTNQHTHIHNTQENKRENKIIKFD